MTDELFHEIMADAGAIALSAKEVLKCSDDLGRSNLLNHIVRRLKKLNETVRRGEK